MSDKFYYITKISVFSCSWFVSFTVNHFTQPHRHLSKSFNWEKIHVLGKRVVAERRRPDWDYSKAWHWPHGKCEKNSPRDTFSDRIHSRKTRRSNVRKMKRKCSEDWSWNRLWNWVWKWKKMFKMICSYLWNAIRWGRKEDKAPQNVIMCFWMLLWIISHEESEIFKAKILRTEHSACLWSW